MNRARMNAGLLILGAICWFVGPVEAAVDPNIPKILLHVRNVTTKNLCSVPELNNNCASTNQMGGVSPASPACHLLVLVDRGDSLSPAAGFDYAQFGIDYQGGYNPSGFMRPINVWSWILCATLQFDTQSPLWPRPGSGTLISWNSCQQSRLVCAGYFYMTAYGPAKFGLTKRPSDNIAKVTACPAQDVQLPEAALGSADFSAGAVTAGCNPCLRDCADAPVTVEDVTWSKVKSLLD